jgi:VIT1/CCC1 family predicted Fe2+/Mn2+ transporter
MSNQPARFSWKKRFALLVTGCLVFLLVFVIAVRITVQQMFMGIASSRATGLSAVAWDVGSMWSSGFGQPMLAMQRGSREQWIARAADIRAHSSSFDQSVDSLHKIVETHRGYFEDLRTESQSGFGRSLAAAIAVPSDQFDGTLSELRGIGRIASISQSGEDSAVKIANAARHLSTAQTNLSRLQKLQRERKGELRDAVALEKDIAEANESVAQAEREQESLKSTVAQSHITFMLSEDYRAPLQVSSADSLLLLRNAFIQGISTIFSTFSFVVGFLLVYGLPLLFWLALLFFPLRAIRRRFLRTPLAETGA